MFFIIYITIVYFLFIFTFYLYKRPRWNLATHVYC